MMRAPALIFVPLRHSCARAPVARSVMHAPMDHERLDVYRLSRELNREIAAITGELPRGAAESADNLRRAAKSIMRNIAEGCGKWLIPDKIHFLQIARGSATECPASLDELVDHGLTTQARVEAAKQLCWRIISMLVALIHKLQNEDR